MTNSSERKDEDYLVSYLWASEAVKLLNAYKAHLEACLPEEHFSEIRNDINQVISSWHQSLRLFSEELPWLGVAKELVKKWQKIPSISSTYRECASELSTAIATTFSVALSVNLIADAPVAPGERYEICRRVRQCAADLTDIGISEETVREELLAMADQMQFGIMPCNTWTPMTTKEPTP